MTRVLIARWKCQIILNPAIQEIFLQGGIDPVKVSEDAVRAEARRIASIQQFHRDVEQTLVAMKREARNG
jgi:hypothetical protein